MSTFYNTINEICHNQNVSTDNKVKIADSALNNHKKELISQVIHNWFLLDKFKSLL